MRCWEEFKDKETEKSEHTIIEKESMWNEETVYLAVSKASRKTA